MKVGVQITGKCNSALDVAMLFCHKFNFKHIPIKYIARSIDDVPMSELKAYHWYGTSKSEIYKWINVEVNNAE